MNNRVTDLLYRGAVCSRCGRVSFKGSAKVSGGALNGVQTGHQLVD